MKASERRQPPLAAGKDAEKDSLCKLFEQKINFGHQHMKTSKPKLTANNIDIKQGDESSSAAYYQPNAAICAERKSSISDLPAFDTEDQSAVTELQQDGVNLRYEYEIILIAEMASMGLPMEFSKPPSAEKKKKGKRKRKKAATECVNTSDNWMIGLDFENYWSLTGTQMDEKVREEQMARTLECKPNNLLECHRSLKDYTNIVYSKEPTKEFTTWEELYQRHCELVKAKTKEDFERLQQQSALSRCKQFIETITALKFVPGYEMVNESEANCCDNSTKMSNDPAIKMSRSSGVVVEDAPISGDEKEQVQPTRKKKLLERSLVSYGDMEMFDDVYADFYAEPSYSSNQQKPTVHTSKASFSEANAHQPFSSNDDEMIENDRKDDHQDGEDDEERLLSMDEKLKFDFGFDEKRDAHLIAKNCFSVFANDRVIY
ncbi:unnamed protein product [Anisakis simplex]|uniref:Myb_DNA-bind_3 domain-containing protein n=1 Tax=Anisakis simplex TaxID=6269 RepID=A0A0M3KBF4_ANISI|nr:unnamed protein product [Anisakis simplex]